VTVHSSCEELQGPATFRSGLLCHSVDTIQADDIISCSALSWRNTIRVVQEKKEGNLKEVQETMEVVSHFELMISESEFH
jgi:hypothetical protein